MWLLTLIAYWSISTGVLGNVANLWCYGAFFLLCSSDSSVQCCDQKWMALSFVLLCFVLGPVVIRAQHFVAPQSVCVSVVNVVYSVFKNKCAGIIQRCILYFFVLFCFLSILIAKTPTPFLILHLHSFHSNFHPQLGFSASVWFSNEISLSKGRIVSIYNSACNLPPGPAEQFPKLCLRLFMPAWF